MSVINSLLLCLLIGLSAQVGVSSTQLSRNYFVASGKYSAVASVQSSVFKTYYFTNSFADTLSSVRDIYYTTAELYAQIRQSLPGSSDVLFLWYELDVANCSNTHLTTSLKAFFGDKYLSSLNYWFLLILDNNPFIGQYMVIKQLQFTKNVSLLQVGYPSAYATGNTITCTPFIKQMRKLFNKNQYQNQNNNLFISSLALSYVQANRSVSISFGLPGYIISYGNYSVKYVCIVTDETSLLTNLPQYKIKSAMKSFSSTPFPTNPSVISISLPISATLTDTNLLIGLATYRCQAKQKFQLTKSLSGTQIKANFFPQVIYSSGYYSYSYAIFPYYDCPSDFPIYYKTTDQCYDGCIQTNQYYDHALKSCQPCPSSCLTCYNAQQCKTCDAAALRQLVNFTCVPIDGYFQSNANISQCSSNCVLCAVSATNCTKCIEPSQVLVGGSCVNCSHMIEGCNSCSGSVCFSCNASYSLFNQTYCNLPCTSADCLVCSNSNTSFCFQCSLGYILIGGICQSNTPSSSTSSNSSTTITPLCGNLVIDMGEECDDGNLINRDGCSSLCKQEQFYQCNTITTIFGVKYTNYCAYTHAIDFALISIEKLSYSNSLRILLSVKQYQELFWDTRSTLGHFLVETPIPYRNMEVSFLSRSPSSVKLTQKLSPTLVSKHPQSSVIAVTFEYLQSIHGQTITLSFNFSQSSDYALTQIPVSNVTLEAVPDNNHYAALYSSQTYSQQKTLSNALLFVAVAAVFVMILTLFVGSKRISTEMLTVIQVAYASLLTTPKVSPLFSAVTSLSAANNGFNLMYSAQLRPFEDTLISNRAKGAQLYSQFLYNFNVGTLFVVLPLLVGVVLFVVSKVRDSDEEGQKRAQRRFQLALGEFTFAGLTFGSCIVGVASVLEVQFGMKEMGTTVGMMSLLAAVLFLFLYAIYGVIRAKSIFLFEEYSGVLLNENFSLGFHLVYFYLGLFTGALLCGLCGFAWVNCAAAVLPLGLYCVTLAKPVFRKQMDRLRTQLNLLTIVLLQAPFLYVNLRDGQAFYSEDDAVLLVPITVVLLLFINLLVNFGFVVYEVIKKVREAMNEREKETNNPKEVQMQKLQIIPQDHSKQFMRPMLINSFIEYSQRQYKELQQMNLFKAQQSPRSGCVGNEFKLNKVFSSVKKQVEEQKQIKENILGRSQMDAQI